MADERPDPASLRYLPADHVRCSDGMLSSFQVCTDDAQPLGRVRGVLIQPSERRLAYLVVDAPGRFTRRRLLLRAIDGAVVHDDARMLQLATASGDLEVEEFSRGAVQDFSDDDLLAALFPAPSAA